VHHVGHLPRIITWCRSTKCKNAGKYVPHYTVSQPKRQPYKKSYSLSSLILLILPISFTFFAFLLSFLNFVPPTILYSPVRLCPSFTDLTDTLLPRVQIIQKGFSMIYHLVFSLNINTQAYANVNLFCTLQEPGRHVDLS